MEDITKFIIGSLLAISVAEWASKKFKSHTLISTFALSDLSPRIVVSYEDAFYEYLGHVFIVVRR